MSQLAHHEGGSKESSARLSGERRNFRPGEWGEQGSLKHDSLSGKPWANKIDNYVKLQTDLCRLHSNCRCVLIALKTVLID